MSQRNHVTRSFVVWGIAICLCGNVSGGRSGSAPVEGSSDVEAIVFDRDVKPLLLRLCVECHGQSKPKGDLRIDSLNPDLVTGNDAETWQDVLDRVNLGDMPPSKSAQPTKEERQVLIRWLTESLRLSAESKRHAAGRVVMRRLTRYEYQNTMRDLLRVNLNFAAELPPEPLSRDGFLNNGADLEMSPTQIEAYLQSARLGLQEAIVSGDQPVVHRFKKRSTDVGQLPNKPVAGHEPANPEFILGIDQFHRRGEFVIRVRAGAIIPAGHDYPRLRLSLGCLPGIIHVPRKIVGEVDVRASVEKPETFTFRGRMEDFPQPGDVPFGNVDFDGMIALIDFLDADGQELRYPDRSYAVPQPNKTPPKKGVAVAREPENYPDAPPLPEDPRLDIVIESVEFESPVVTVWPPQSHTQILLAGHVESQNRADERRTVHDVLRRFMSRAFRRPVSDSEVESAVAFFDSVRTESADFKEALRETLASVLVSPHFLYIVETRGGSDGESEATSQRLTDFELAARLSYFLWSSMPDDRLYELAEKNELSRLPIIEQEVQRMLHDERSTEFLARFADQWFDLNALDRVAVNPEFFPDFDESLKFEMAEQARAFLAEIVRSDSSCLDLLDSDWAMLNRPLAKHYGIDGPRSSAFERTGLKVGDQRGGLLGQGAFLLSNSDGEQPHPIKRAVWILDRLLDSPPAPPPPDVPELDTESPDLAGLSLKQQLALHRDKESCRDCHRGIDPWGVPLEQFNAVGLLQTESAVRRSSKAKGKGRLAGAAVDASSVLPDGTKINGLHELKTYLREHRRELFARAVVKRLTAYALGRSLDPGDRTTVDELTSVFIESDFRFNQLIVALVKSDSFLTK